MAVLHSQYVIANVFADEFQAGKMSGGLVIASNEAIGVPSIQSLCGPIVELNCGHPIQRWDKSPLACASGRANRLVAIGALPAEN
jgi:hypothetical protein